MERVAFQYQVEQLIRTGSDEISLWLVLIAQNPRANSSILGPFNSFHKALFLDKKERQ